jgi:dienelactone hydrolase
MPAAVREDFRKLVTAGRKTVDLNPRLISRSAVGTVITERVKFNTEEGQEAVALIFRPKEEAKYPAVIAQHFLGGSKDHLLFAAMLNGLAQRGYLAVAIDGRYRGERQNGKSLAAAMAETLKTGKGHPWLIDTVFDVTRLVDYLQTRPDVDADRIGMTGISEGGVVTWMATAIDDRIKVAAPVIGVTCFAESLGQLGDPGSENQLKLLEDLKPALKDFATQIGEMDVNGKVLRAAWAKLVPGGLDRFDGPSLLPQIAPRPLLILNHEKDELFALPGAEKVVQVARARYKELNAADHIDFKVQPGLKHADAGALFAELGQVNQWMDRWLKPKALAAGK